MVYAPEIFSMWEHSGITKVPMILRFSPTKAMALLSVWHQWGAIILVVLFIWRISLLLHAQTISTDPIMTETVWNNWGTPVPAPQQKRTTMCIWRNKSIYSLITGNWPQCQWSGIGLTACLSKKWKPKLIY